MIGWRAPSLSAGLFSANCWLSHYRSKHTSHLPVPHSCCRRDALHTAEHRLSCKSRSDSIPGGHRENGACELMTKFVNELSDPTSLLAPSKPQAGGKFGPHHLPRTSFRRRPPDQRPSFECESTRLTQGFDQFDPPKAKPQVVLTLCSKNVIRLTT